MAKSLKASSISCYSFGPYWGQGEFDCQRRRLNQKRRISWKRTAMRQPFLFSVLIQIPVNIAAPVQDAMDFNHIIAHYIENEIIVDRHPAVDLVELPAGIHLVHLGEFGQLLNFPDNGSYCCTAVDS
ncbi:hypothetical protein [Sporolactobacillus mangiferae]|uniref:hypothetical protein n=1 Tax=Sporolactobacillus mangiferae TaxID=2940498 RepID=UPI003F625FC7